MDTNINKINKLINYLTKLIFLSLFFYIIPLITVSIYTKHLQIKEELRNANLQLDSARCAYFREYKKLNFKKGYLQALKDLNKDLEKK